MGSQAGLRSRLLRRSTPHRRHPLFPQAEATQVGSTYANALIEAAQAENSLEDVHSDVDALAGLLRENKV